MSEVDFDARTHARSLDPSTSHAAAQSLAQFARGHCKVILAALEQYGPMTVDEIAARTPLKSQQINKRTSDLHKKGLIRPTGELRRSDSGHLERVWERVQAPIPTHAQLHLQPGSA